MFSSKDDIRTQLEELDGMLPDGVFAELVILGGAAMFFSTILITE